MQLKRRMLRSVVAKADTIFLASDCSGKNVSRGRYKQTVGRLGEFRRDPVDASSVGCFQKDQPAGSMGYPSGGSRWKKLGRTIRTGSDSNIWTRLLRKGRCPYLPLSRTPILCQSGSASSARLTGRRTRQSVLLMLSIFSKRTRGAGHINPKRGSTAGIPVTTLFTTRLTVLVTTRALAIAKAKFHRSGL